MFFFKKLSFLILLTLVAVKQTSSVTNGQYSILFVPDTQHDISGNFGEDTYNAFQWIKACREYCNISAVVGLGDITDFSSLREWRRMGNTLLPLRESGIPHAFAKGNHDSNSIINGIHLYKSFVWHPSQNWDVEETPWLDIYDSPIGFYSTGRIGFLLLDSFFISIETNTPQRSYMIDKFKWMLNSSLFDIIFLVNHYAYAIDTEIILNSVVEIPLDVFVVVIGGHTITQRISLSHNNRVIVVTSNYQMSDTNSWMQGQSMGGALAWFRIDPFQHVLEMSTYSPLLGIFLKTAESGFGFYNQSHLSRGIGVFTKCPYFLYIPNGTFIFIIIAFCIILVSVFLFLLIFIVAVRKIKIN